MKLRSDRRHGRAPVSQNQLHGAGGGYSSPSSVAARIVANVSVLVAAWLDDDGSGTPVTPTYTDAPRLGTIKYADIEHNLGSEAAFAVGFIDQTTGRWYSQFVDQIKISDGTLRVWLPAAPANPVTIKVIV